MSLPPPYPEPQSESELLMRARALSGATLAELGETARIDVPTDLRRAKGFVGSLIERLLGARAASRAEPDFPSLGVELKTLPVDRRGRPVESTFVCTISLTEVTDMQWRSSRARSKLARVLWIPVQGERQIPVPDRRVGEPLLWSPDPQQDAALQLDWEEFAGLIGRGDIESISGHLGRCLQVRPKARNSKARRRGFDEDGVPFATLPRGFYLRASFTGSILRQHFALPR